jgi:hypothetical protein
MRRKMALAALGEKMRNAMKTRCWEGGLKPKVVAAGRFWVYVNDTVAGIVFIAKSASLVNSSRKSNGYSIDAEWLKVIRALRRYTLRYM